MSQMDRHTPAAMCWGVGIDAHSVLEGRGRKEECGTSDEPGEWLRTVLDRNGKAG
jgi:hypothetical protein